MSSYLPPGVDPNSLGFSMPAAMGIVHKDDPYQLSMRNAIPLPGDAIPTTYPYMRFYDIMNKIIDERLNNSMARYVFVALFRFVRTNALNVKTLFSTVDIVEPSSVPFLSVGKTITSKEFEVEVQDERTSLNAAEIEEQIESVNPAGRELAMRKIYALVDGIFAKKFRRCAETMKMASILSLSRVWALEGMQAVPTYEALSSTFWNMFAILNRDPTIGFSNLCTAVCELLGVDATHFLMIVPPGIRAMIVGTRDMHNYSYTGHAHGDVFGPGRKSEDSIFMTDGGYRVLELPWPRTKNEVGQPLDHPLLDPAMHGSYVRMVPFARTLSDYSAQNYKTSSLDVRFWCEGAKHHVVVTAEDAAKYSGLMCLMENPDVFIQKTAGCQNSMFVNVDPRDGGMFFRHIKDLEHYHAALKYNIDSRGMQWKAPQVLEGLVTAVENETLGGVQLTVERFKAMLANDIPIPFNFMIWIPHIMRQMATFIGLRTDGSSGIPNIGDIRIRSSTIVPSSDGTNGNSITTASSHYSVVLNDPSAVIPIPCAASARYVSGDNGTFVDLSCSPDSPSNVSELYTDFFDPGRPSMIVSLMPFKDESDGRDYPFNGRFTASSFMGAPRPKDIADLENKTKRYFNTELMDALSESTFDSNLMSNDFYVTSVQSDPGNALSISTFGSIVNVVCKERRTERRNIRTGDWVVAEEGRGPFDMDGMSRLNLSLKLF